MGLGFCVQKCCVSQKSSCFQNMFVGLLFSSIFLSFIPSYVSSWLSYNQVLNITNHTHSFTPEQQVYQILYNDLYNVPVIYLCGLSMFLGVLFIEFLTVPKTCSSTAFKVSSNKEPLYTPTEEVDDDETMERNIIPSTRSFITRHYDIKTSCIFLVGSFVYLILDNLYLGTTLNTHMSEGVYYILELLFNRFPLYLTMGAVLRCGRCSTKMKLVSGILVSVIPNLFSLITYFYPITQMNVMYFVLLLSIGVLLDMTYLLVDNFIRKNCGNFCSFSVGCLLYIVFYGLFQVLSSIYL